MNERSVPGLRWIHACAPDELGMSGFERFQLGLLDGDIQRDENGTFLDDLPGLERDTAHRTRQLIADADRTRRHHSADSSGHRSVFALPGDGRLHGFHRLGLMGCGSALPVAITATTRTIDAILRFNMETQLPGGGRNEGNGAYLIHGAAIEKPGAAKLTRSSEAAMRCPIVGVSRVRDGT